MNKKIKPTKAYKIPDSLGGYDCHVCGIGANKYKRPKNHRIYKSLHPLNIGYGDNNFDHVNIFQSARSSATF